MNCLSIIPARGGSKGIPRKNIHALAGRPLISWTIEAANRAKLVDRVIVSTDDPEIAAASKEHGAEVIWRPEQISGDLASSESALLHTLDVLERKEGYKPDITVFLQCTSPLTLAEDIDGTVKVLLDENADSALAVTPFHYFLWKRDTNVGATGINHDKRLRLLRQQSEDQFLEVGAVYAMKTQEFREVKHRFFGNTALYVMPPERVLEIDEPIDLEIAEILLRKREQSRKLELIPDDPAALIMDFDGVFTDNSVFVFQDGKEAVRCDRSDGWGMMLLREVGLPLLILSTEKNPVVQARANKLGIPCLQGVQDKYATLISWCGERNIPLSRVVYLGNDMNDIQCLRAVGCPTVVNNAHPDTFKVARLILNSRGGEGALRELSDLIIIKLKKREQYESID